MTKTGAKADHHDLVKNMSRGHHRSIEPTVSPTIKFGPRIPDLSRYETPPQFGHLTGPFRHFKWPVRKPIQSVLQCGQIAIPLCSLSFGGYEKIRLKIKQTLLPERLFSHFVPAKFAKWRTERARVHGR